MAQDVQAQACAPSVPSDALHISKPRDGKTVIVHPSLARTFAFEFPINEVKVVVKGEDIHLVFSDGAQIILPGLGIDLASSESPSLFFDCQLQTAQDLYAQVGQVEIADIYSSETMQTVVSTNAIADEAYNPNTAMAPSRVDSLQPSEKQPIVFAEALMTSAVNNVYAPTGASTVINNVINNNNNDTGSGGGGVQLATIAFQTYGYTTTSTEVVDGVTTIVGAAANLPTKAPPLADGLGDGATLSQLMQSETLAGTSAGDQIFGDPTVAGAGNSLIVPRVSMLLTGNTAPGTLEVKLPSGYALVTTDPGFQSVAPGVYVLKFPTAGSSITFDMNLVYAVPYGQTGPDADGFYGAISQINFAFTPDGAEDSQVIFGALSVGVRSVSSQSDMTFTTANGTSVLVLPSIPAGNSINGFEGNDTLYAGAGADTIDGGDGIDTVSYAKSNGGVSVVLGEGGQAQAQQSLGYARSDIILNAENLEGSLASDTLVGNSGDNSLSGGPAGDIGDDSLSGGDGADTFNGGAGANTLVGGQGNDIFIVSSTTDVIVEAAGGGLDTILVNGASVVTMGANVEKLVNTTSADLLAIGNASANTMIGNSGRDTLSGGDESDSLVGGASADSLVGGAGNDSLEGDAGVNTMAGGTGDDLYYVSSQLDEIVEQQNEGTDTVRVSNIGGFTLAANVENMIVDTAGDFSGLGNALDNDIRASDIGDGRNTLDGGAGADTLRGGNSDDVLMGGSGNDLIQALAGADTIDGGTGADTMSGGAGNDLYLVDNVGDTVIELVADGIDAIVIGTTGQAGGLSDADGNQVPVNYSLQPNDNVEVLEYRGISASTLIGSNISNTIIGGTGDDSLSGEGGDDSLLGKAGADTLLGGDGKDTLAGGEGDDVYILADASDVISGEATLTSIDTAIIRYTPTGPIELGTGNLVGIERLIYEGSAPFTGVGDGQDNTIIGGTGINRLVGGGGADSLLGNAQADTLDGGGGADTMQGGAGNDVYVMNSLDGLVLEAAGTDVGGVDTVLTELTGFSLNGGLTDNVENLTYLGTENFTGQGSDIDNVITGGAGANSLAGLVGADTLVGKGNLDTLDGGTGNDVLSSGDGAASLFGGDDDDSITAGIGANTIDGGNGNDTIRITGGLSTATGGAGDDTLFGSTDASTLDGGDGNDSLVGGAGSESLTGGLLNDTITAGGGQDTLDGGDGNDSLVGTIAAETMYGGDGADTLASGGAPSTANADSLMGGAGNDIYVLNVGSQASKSIFINDASGIDEIQTTFTLYDLRQDNNNTVENLTFTGGGASGTGNILANVIKGSDTGGDTLQAFANTGADALKGDTLIGNGGNDVLLGTATASGVSLPGDYFDGGLGADTISATGGANTISGGDDNDSISGGAGGDSISADAGSDTVLGNLGNDTIFGGSGANSINGGDGSDRIEVLDDANTIDAGEGANTVIAGNGGNRIAAGTGADSITSGTGADSINAGDGDNTISDAGGATNEISTLGGNDRITTSGSSNDTISAGDGANTISDAGGAQNLITAGTGADSITAGAGADTIGAGDGNNVIAAGDGANSITAGTGADSITSGTGADSINAGDGDNRISDTGGATNEISTLGGNDRITTSGSSNDTISAGDGANTISDAGGTQNLITTGSGADSITSGGGADTISSGDDNDTLLAGNGANSIDAGAGADTILAGSGVDTILGGGGNDTIDGGTGADSLSGGDGQDLFYLSGTDTALGGDGDDTFIVSANGDSIVGGDGPPGAIDTIEIQGPLGGTGRVFSLADRTTGIEVLKYTGDGGFSLAGDAGVNTIYGNDGNDSLRGGGGATDWLVGNGGADTLNGAGGAVTMTGGTGSNIYLVDSIDDVVDQIARVGGDTLTTNEIRTTLQNYSMGSGNLHIQQLSYIGNATVSGGAGFSARGDQGDQTIVGTAGNDSLQCGEGTDAVVMAINATSFGANTQIGTYRYNGQDLALYDLTDPATIGGLSLAVSRLQIVIDGTGIGKDTIVGGEYIILNNGVLKINTGLTLYGDQGPGVNFSNVAWGTATGAAANDSFVGSTLGDNLLGGRGNDIYLINNIDDTVSEAYTVAGNGSVTDAGGIDTAIVTQAYATQYISRNGGTTAAISIDLDNAMPADPANGQGTGPIKNFVNTGASSTGVENLILDAAVTTGFSITGNILDNSIVGAQGNDTITTGGGNDTLDGRTGANSLIGGVGNDLYILAPNSASAAQVLENASGGVDEVWATAAGGYTLSSSTGANLFGNVENIALQNAAGVAVTSGQFTLAGSSVDNEMWGGGKGSSASIAAFDGNDTLVSRGGTDTLAGASGNDLYIVTGDGTAAVNGGVEISFDNSGTDQIWTTLNSFDLSDATGGAALKDIERLIYIAGLGANTGTSGSFDSTVGSGSFTGIGNALANTIIGGNGGNSLIGAAGNDVLAGGSGADTLDGAASDAGTNNGSFADTMSGGSGNDWYLVNSLGDLVVGEASLPDNSPTAGFIDTIQIQDAGLIASNGAQSANAYTLGGTSNVENLIYQGALNFTLSGNALANSITGGSGNDSLYGGVDGVDTLAGGAGNDTYQVDSLFTQIVENPGGGTADLVRTTLTGYTLTGNVENLQAWSQTGQGVATGIQNVSLQGNELANSIVGGAGADALDGGANAFAIAGDTLVGGVGNDYYIVRPGDQISEASGTAAGIDTVELRFDPQQFITLGANNTLPSGNLNLAGIENYVNGWTTGAQVIGSSAANAIVGNALQGNSLDGRGGADTLVGSTGNDAYWLYNAGETVIDNGGADTVYAVATVADISGLSGIDVLVRVPYGAPTTGGAVSFAFTGIGNDSGNTIIGASGGPNSLVGGLGADSLQGGGSIDTISGGAGANTIDAGAGSNSIVALDGANLILAGTGSDTISVGNGANMIDAGAGFNLIVALDGANQILAGTGGDTISVGNGGNAINADAGNNSITAGTLNGADSISVLGGIDTILSGAGNDSILAGDGNNSVDAGADNDSVISGTGADTIFGGSGFDTIDAGAGLNSVNAGANNDSVTTGSNADTIDGGLGNDTMSGSGGNDVYFVDTAGDAIIEVAANTSVNWNGTVVGGIDEVRLLGLSSYSLAPADKTSGLWNVENLSAFGADGATTTGAFSLAGNNMNNVISGSEGNDTLSAGWGRDTLVGNGGNDRLQVASQGDFAAVTTRAYVAPGFNKQLGISKSVSLSFEAVTADTNNSQIINVNGAQLTGNPNTGTQLSYNTTSITLKVAAGFLYTFNLPAPKDGLSHVITASWDVVTFGSNPQGAARVWLDKTELALTSWGGTVAAGTINGDGTLSTGNTNWTVDTYDDIRIFDSTLSGTDVENIVNAVGTNSTGPITSNLLGLYMFNNGSAANAATVTSGAGGQFSTLDSRDYIGDSGFASLAGGAGADTLVGYLGGDTLDGGSGADSLNAGDGPNSLLGGSGNDTLIAGTGLDWLDGGTEADSMAGGNGNDFYFVDNSGTNGTNGDRILEVASGGTLDAIRVSGQWAQSGVNTINLLTNSAFVNVEGFGVDTRAGASLAGDARFFVTASNSASSLTGWNNADTLVGGNGNDTLDGAGGANSLMGSAGDDFYVTIAVAQGNLTNFVSNDTVSDLSGTNDVLIVNNGASGNALFVNMAAPTFQPQFAGIEGITSGTNFNFATIVGDGNDNSITGSQVLGGANSLVGGAGNDTFRFGTGQDTVDGGLGNDTYNIARDGSILITDAGGQNQVNLVGATFYNGLTMQAAGTSIRTIIDFVGQSAATSIGDNSDNVISNANGNNAFGVRWYDGSLGNDTYLGQGGNDTISLNMGDANNGLDRVDGNNGSDTGRFYNTSGSVATVTLTATQLDTIFANTEILNFQGPNVAAGGAAAPILFSASDIQGIQNGASVEGGGNLSQLIVQANASGADRDYIGIAGGNYTVRDSALNIVATNTNLVTSTKNTETYTFTDNDTNAVVAKLVIQAS